MVLAAEQLAWALALLFAFFALLVLVGTNLLPWQWLLMPCLAGAAFVWLRLRQRALVPYRVAQIVDERLSLHDSLSTAWFLLTRTTSGSVSASEKEIENLQIRRAEEIAPTVEPAQVFPFTGARTWAITGLVALAFITLFGIRYWRTSSLDLRQALIPVNLHGVLDSSNPTPAIEKREHAKDASDQNGKADSDANQQTGNASERLPGQSESDQPQLAGGNQPGNSPSDALNQPNSQEKQSNGSEGNDANAQGKPAGEQASSKQDGAEPNADAQKKAANGDQNSSGLINKMKDMAAGLMAKMSPSQNAQKQSQNGDPAKQNQSSREQNSPGERAEQNDNRDKAKDAQNGTSEAPAQGQTTENSEAAKNHTSGQSSQNGSDAHSGVGKQNGDKQNHEAEQQQAMGKLAEIIGKRSATVTGDMMVETSGGKQQLKTEYSQKTAHHADLGGEINRDDIPLADQQYVREYMELVHKQAETRSKSAPSN